MMNPFSFLIVGSLFRFYSMLFVRFLLLKFSLNSSHGVLIIVPVAETKEKLHSLLENVL